MRRLDGVEGSLVLEPAEQNQIYQIVQEAISNVCRHSAATHVRLRLAVETNGELVIELEDNGQGFDTNKLAQIGRGLTNIRSRASLIEANVTWNARPDGGTLFTLHKASAAKSEPIG